MTAQQGRRLAAAEWQSQRRVAWRRWVETCLAYVPEEGREAAREALGKLRPMQVARALQATLDRLPPEARERCLRDFQAACAQVRAREAPR